MNVVAFRIYENVALIHIYSGEGVGDDLLPDALNVVVINDLELFLSEDLSGKFSEVFLSLPFTSSRVFVCCQLDPSLLQPLLRL